MVGDSAGKSMFQRWRSLLAVLAIVFTTYFLHTAIFGEITIQNLARYHDALQSFYEDEPVFTVMVYLLTYIVTTALTIPVAVPLSVAGGMLFGLWYGTFLVATAATIGATLSFLAARHLFRDQVQRRFGKQLATVNAHVCSDGPYYLFTIRLIPVFPFFLINVLLGLTSIRTFDYMWVSFVGMLAGTMVYVNAGVELGKITKFEEIMSPDMIIAFTIIGLLPIVAQKVVTAVSYFAGAKNDSHSK